MAMNNEDLVKARARRDKAAQACAKKLIAAADALTAYLKACNQCYDDTAVVEFGDHRIELRDGIQAFATYLTPSLPKEKATNDVPGKEKLIGYQCRV